MLVDTSVWVDHLRRGNRDLSLLAVLPQATVAGHDEVMRVDQDKLHGRGLGWIDVHLLTSALLTHCSLWTIDKALAAAARSLRLDA